MALAKPVAQQKGVPAGFEDLIFGRDAVVAVRCLGRTLGHFSALVEADVITFKNPDYILSELPLISTVGDDDRAVLLRTLSAPMSRNSDHLCSPKRGMVEVCNFVDANTVALLFDEENDAAELFVKKEWVAPVTSSVRLRELSAQTQRAFLQRQLINVAVSERRHSFTAAFAAALGISPHSYIGSNYHFVSNGYAGRSYDRIQLDNFYYRHDMARRFYVQTGLMDARTLASPLGGSFGFEMMPVGRVLGGRFGTTQAYSSNTTFSERTHLTILLTQAARVDAYREDMLLGSFYLAAGAQEIDTSSFPAGSYMVRLQVVEGGRVVRAEQLPFSRVDNGAGRAGDVQWFLQAGQDESDAFRRGAHAGRSVSMLAGIKLALSPAAGLTFGLAEQRGQWFGEGRLDWQNVSDWGPIRASAAFFAGGDGSRGDSERLSWGNRLSVHLYRINRYSQDCRSGNYMGCYRSLSASVYARLSDWNLSASYGQGWSAYSYRDPRRWRERDEDDVGGATSPSSAVVDGLRSGHWIDREVRSERAELSAGRTFRFNRVTVTPRLTLYSRRMRDRREHGGLAVVSLTRASPVTAVAGYQGYTSASLSHERGHRRASLTQFRASQGWSKSEGVHRDASVSVAGSAADRLDLNIRNRFEGQWGLADATIADSYMRHARERRHQLSFTGSYGSAFALSGAGGFWGVDRGGGDPLAGVGVIVAAADEGDDTSHPVAQVWDRRIGFGAHALIPIEGFRAYDMRIQDIGGTRAGGVASLRSGSGRRQWFMLPGSLGVQHVSASLIYTYVGRLRIAGGQALAGDSETLEGGALLDASVPEIGPGGGFVADFSYRPKRVHVLKSGLTYACDMPERTGKDASAGSVLRVGVIDCYPIVLDALPKKLMSNPRLRPLLESRRSSVDE